MRFLLGLLLVCLTSHAVYGGDLLHYSGRLVNTATGGPILGTPDIRIKIYEENSLKCTLDVNDVALSNGVFNLELNFETAHCSGVSFVSVLNAALSADKKLYIELTDLTNAPGAPYPKQNIGPVPLALYALNSKNSVSAIDDLLDTHFKGISTSCADGEVLKTDGLGGFRCGTDLTSLGTVTTVSVLSPLQVMNSNTTPQISISQASSVSSGYLSQNDWNTFSNKEPMISVGTSAEYWRGDKTWQTLDTSAVPENGHLYFTDERARLALSASLTEKQDALIAVSPIKLATSTISLEMESITGSYLQGNPLCSLPGEYLTYKLPGGFVCESESASGNGVWGTSAGNVYREAGMVGIGTATPTSMLHVAGGIQLGADSGPCDASKAGTIRFHLTNVEYCNGSSWRAFGVSGSGVTSVSAAAPLSVVNGSSSPSLSIAQASAVSDGYLSSADWSHFNNKQPNDATLAALATLDSSTGVIVQTAADIFTKRTLSGTLHRVSVVNGDGVLGNPTWDIDTNLLPSPVSSGTYLKSTGANTAAWSVINGTDIDLGTIQNTQLNGIGAFCSNNELIKANGIGGFQCGGIMNGLPAENGAAATPSISFLNSLGTGFYLPLVNELGVSTSGIERMRIDSSGKMGIGTAPVGSNQLTVTATSGWAIATNSPTNSYGVVSNSGGIQVGIGGLGVRGILTTVTNHDLQLGTSNAGNIPLTIATSGNIGIGTNSPASTLHLAKNNAGTLIKIENTDSIGNHWPGLQITNYMGGTNFGGAPVFTMRNARGSSVAPTAAQAGDVLGTFGAYGYGTTLFRSGSEIQFVATENHTDSNAGEKIVFRTASNGSTSRSDRLTIDHGGKVGIGTSAPFSKLEVTHINLNNPATSGTVDNAAGVRYSVSLFGLDFGINPSGSSWLQSRRTNDFSLNYQLLLNPNGGNVGVGTLAPASKLHVAGGVQLGADAATCDATKVGTLRLNLVSIEFCDGVSWKAFSVSGGTVTSVSASAPLSVVNSSSTPSLSIAQANSSSDGYLSSADWTIFNNKQAGDATLTGLASLDASPGVLVQTGVDTFLKRTITGVANRIAITNGDGSSGNISIDLNTSLFPSPLDGNSGQYFKATGANTASWTTISGTDISSGTIQNTQLNGIGAFCSHNELIKANGTGGFLCGGALNQLLAIDGTSASPSIAFINSPHTGIFQPASETFAVTTSGIERFRISSSGNIGLGTVNPGARWHVVDGVSAFENTSAGNSGPNFSFWKHRNYSATVSGDELGFISFYGHDGSGLQRSSYIVSKAEGASSENSVPAYLAFYTTSPSMTDSSEKMRITSSGNVGIGIASPDVMLEVNGTIVGKANTTNTGTTIDFSTGNLQGTTASCSNSPFNLTNLKSGGVYTLAIQGLLGGVCSFTANGGALTVKSGSVSLSQTSSKHIVFSFAVVGSYVYVDSVDAY